MKFLSRIFFFFIFCMVAPLFGTQPELTIENLEQLLLATQDPLLQKELQEIICKKKENDINAAQFTSNALNIQELVRPSPIKKKFFDLFYKSDDEKKWYEKKRYLGVIGLLIIALGYGIKLGFDCYLQEKKRLDDSLYALSEEIKREKKEHEQKYDEQKICNDALKQEMELYKAYSENRAIEQQKIIEQHSNGLIQQQETLDSHSSELDQLKVDLQEYIEEVRSNYAQFNEHKEEVLQRLDDQNGKLEQLKEIIQRYYDDLLHVIRQEKAQVDKEIRSLNQTLQKIEEAFEVEKQKQSAENVFFNEAIKVLNAFSESTKERFLAIKNYNQALGGCIKENDIFINKRYESLRETINKIIECLKAQDEVLGIKANKWF